MMGYLFSTYYRLLENTNYITHRYLFDHFSIENRLTGIIGPRGTGKTTMMLQLIKERIKDIEKSFYASLDNIYFSRNSLYELVTELYEKENRKFFFFDEIHKYENWTQELKNLYDSFPDIKIIFSGSSSINLIYGMHDLSRRAVTYNLNGLSFREFLNFKLNKDYSTLDFDSIIRNPEEYSKNIADIPGLRGQFEVYLNKGYYPFYFEGEELYESKVMNIINKTVYEDIPNIYNLKTENLRYFKKILAFLAGIPPGELSINNLSKNMKLDNKTISHYLEIMGKIGLVCKVETFKQGNVFLRSPEKFYLDNTNLYHSVASEIGYTVSRGTIREIFFVKSIINSKIKLHYSKIGDFRIGESIFEIGGKNKNKKQIKEKLDNSFLVKDDILYGRKSVIPLYLFGFLY